MPPAPGPVHLRAAGVSLVLTTNGERLPAVLHWGADLGELAPADLAALATSGIPAAVPNDLDEVARIGVLPEHASGWPGRPGLAGRRGGRAWSSLFALTALDVAPAPDGGGRVVATGRDEDAGLELRLEIELLPTGLLRQRGTVTALPGSADLSADLSPDLSDERFVVDGLALTVPVPPV